MTKTLPSHDVPHGDVMSTSDVNIEPTSSLNLSLRFRVEQPVPVSDTRMAFGFCLDGDYSSEFLPDRHYSPEPMPRAIDSPEPTYNFIVNTEEIEEAGLVPEPSFDLSMEPTPRVVDSPEPSYQFIVNPEEIEGDELGSEPTFDLSLEPTPRVVDSPEPSYQFIVNPEEIEDDKLGSEPTFDFSRPATPRVIYSPEPTPRVTLGSEEMDGVVRRPVPELNLLLEPAEGLAFRAEGMDDLMMFGDLRIGYRPESTPEVTIKVEPMDAIIFRPEPRVHLPPQQSPLIVMRAEGMGDDHGVVFGEALSLYSPVPQSQPEALYATPDKTMPNFSLQSLPTRLPRAGIESHPSHIMEHTWPEQALESTQDIEDIKAVDFPELTLYPHQRPLPDFSTLSRPSLQVQQQMHLPEPSLLGQLNNRSKRRCNQLKHRFHLCVKCWQHPGMSRIFYCCKCRQETLDYIRGIPRLVLDDDSDSDDEDPRPDNGPSTVSHRQSSAARTKLPSSRLPRSDLPKSDLPKSKLRNSELSSSDIPFAGFSEEELSIVSSNLVDSAEKRRRFPYLREQVHWLRYVRVDAGRAWRDMPLLWRLQWPEANRIGLQALRSKLARDNVMPLNLATGEVLLHEDMVVLDNYRGANNGAALRGLSSLIQRHPAEALRYDWVSTRLKDKAREVIGEDQLHPNTREAVYRKLLRQWNQTLERYETMQFGKLGNPSFYMPQVILVEHRNVEVSQLCWCDSNGGHSTDCEGWSLLMDKGCDCPLEIMDLTQHHLPKCYSRPHLRC